MYPQQKLGHPCWQNKISHHQWGFYNNISLGKELFNFKVIQKLSEIQTSLMNAVRNK